MGWQPRRGDDPDIHLHRHTAPRPETCNTPRTCNPTTITILNRFDSKWKTGKTWGLRLYLSGKDLGTLFTIQKITVPLLSNPIGPNRIFNPRPPTPRPGTPPTPSTASKPIYKQNWNLTGDQLDPHLKHSLIKTSDSVFRLLNETNPKTTEECWLCLDLSPP